MQDINFDSGDCIDVSPRPYCPLVWNLYGWNKRVPVQLAVTQVSPPPSEDSDELF